MRQRAMIAMALACNPGVLIADEPTTALDVTIQAQVLDLMRDLQERLGTAVVLITHDLGVVAETAHRVVVMYAGRKVEEASVEEIFARALASLHARASSHRCHAWAAVAVASPRFRAWCQRCRNCRPGCAFAPRCPRADERCRGSVPPFEMDEGHGVACWHA